MAWIHPETNGDYRIIGRTIADHAGTNSSIAHYDGLIQSDIASISDLNDIVTSSLWKALATTQDDPSAQSIYGTAPAAYNIQGELVVNDNTDFDNDTLTNAIMYKFDGTSTGGFTWTGHWTKSGPPDVQLGGSSVYAGQAGAIDNTWFDGVGPPPGGNLSALSIYGFSPDISTISGSLSGTISRSQTTIWVVGAINLTSDIDFGGDVDLKAALDVSQTPTFSGDYFIDVGPGGSIVDLGIPIKIKDSGTNNGTSGNIGSGIKVR